MPRSKNFKQDQIVKFMKKANAYDLETNKEFIVPRGTTAKIILDEDVGEIGSCKIKLKKKDGTIVLAETNDQFLE